MAILYENCPVTIDVNGDVIATTPVYAKSASIDEGIGIEQLKALGLSNVNVAANEAPQGSFSIDCYIHNNTLISTLQSFKESSDYFNCQVGPYIIKKCLFTSLSLSASPNAIVDATFSTDFFGGIEKVAIPSSATATESAAHSSNMTTDFAGVGFAGETFSFSYDLSQSYNLIYSLTGGFSPVVKQVQGGEETMGIEGADIGNNLTGADGVVCLENVGVLTASFDDGCGNARGSVTMSGYLNSRDVAVSEDDIVRGNVNVIYYY